ncbi:hypothetical protein KPH14_001816 [Odynerus spinipes]|uniref:Uncharacterized protein n=1 Tax=Odynerus spinipes TaxID=1348599 RepID=A0AAD9VX04_9HYME|nr:hypothetical protein KPH14_001816 [Odynerus spinipes]
MLQRIYHEREVCHDANKCHSALSMGLGKLTRPSSQTTKRHRKKRRRKKDGVDKKNVKTSSKLDPLGCRNKFYIYHSVKDTTLNRFRKGYFWK